MSIAKIKEYRISDSKAGNGIKVNGFMLNGSGFLRSNGKKLPAIVSDRMTFFLILTILLSTFISYRFVFNYTINPDVAGRMEMEHQILSGSARPPYQYRVLKPVAGTVVQNVLTPVITDPVKRHLIAYEIIIFITFAGIFAVTGLHLKQQFSSLSAVIGIMLLQAAIPLSLTGQWQEGDFYNLFFYAAGILLFYSRKDHYLPLVFLIGAFNREQIIFLNVFYAIYLYSEHKLWKRRGIVILLSNTIIFGIVFLGLRLFFGFKPNEYTVEFNTSNNIASLGVISRLWVEMFSVFLILVIAVFRKCSLYYRLSFISLGVYVLVFFHKGFLWELAKFLPAYLIMIPMCLQYLDLEHWQDKMHVRLRH